MESAWKRVSPDENTGERIEKRLATGVRVYEKRDRHLECGENVRGGVRVQIAIVQCNRDRPPRDVAGGCGVDEYLQRHGLASTCQVFHLPVEYLRRKTQAARI